MSSFKVSFRLEQDEEGYPPVAVETLWALPGEQAGEFVIDNVPFFVRVATLGDTVRVREIDGNLWFDCLVRQAQNSLVRVVFFDRDSVETLKDHLISIGCSTEYLGQHSLMAVNVPVGVNLAEVQGYLQAEAASGRIDFEAPIVRNYAEGQTW